MSKKHLIIYDGQCGFCNRIIRWILKIDHKKQFLFTSLQGQTAAKLKRQLSFTIPLPDSIILIKNYSSNQPSIFYYSQAVFQIFWLLGNLWAVVGSLNFLPSFLFDVIYQGIATKRHLLFSKNKCPIISSADLKRFLP